MNLPNFINLKSSNLILIISKLLDCRNAKLLIVQFFLIFFFCKFNCPLKAILWTACFKYQIPLLMTHFSVTSAGSNRLITPKSFNNKPIFRKIQFYQILPSSETHQIKSPNYLIALWNVKKPKTNHIIRSINRHFYDLFKTSIIPCKFH